MKYQKLVDFYMQVSSTTKRLEKIKILSEFLKKIPVEETYVNKEWKEIGDLGLVSKKLKEKKSQATLSRRDLTTEKVLDNLRKLPVLEGKGTVGKKISLIVELLVSASASESLYLVRTLIGDLRIGLKESTIKEAFAVAFFSQDKKKEASQKIQGAIDKSNDIALVFQAIRTGKLKNLEDILLEIGKPIKAMLAQKVETIKDGFKALGIPCAIEYKYDGFRLIIHKKPSGEVILFTRRLENVTKQFPEVVDYIKKYVRGNSFILDSEAVGFDKKTREYRPFQSISQRIRRKYNIEKLREELPVEINVFDVLYYNGKSLLDEPFEKRSTLIRKIVQNERYKIICSKQIITSSEKVAGNFYKRALKDNQEGIMMKNLKAKYQPGRRVGHMLKIKPEEGDFDLVITGAEYGTGKRSGWMSSFILSCHDEDTGKYLEVGKVSTGLKEKYDNKQSDDKIKEERMIQEETIGTSFFELTEKLAPLIKKESGKYVELKPRVIVSVTYQEIQRSPNYR